MAGAHGAIPVVVSVSVAVPEKAAGGVQVALGEVADGLNVPPALELQVTPVADPPKAPERAMLVSWQID